MLERYKMAACSSEAISLSICYAILLVLSVFCFLKTNPNVQRFRTLLSFCLGIEKQKLIHNECLQFSVDKCRPTAKVCSTCKIVCLLIRPFVSIRTLTRLQIIQIAVENQCEKKAHGDPLHILNLP